MPTRFTPFTINNRFFSDCVPFLLSVSFLFPFLIYLFVHLFIPSFIFLFVCLFAYSFISSFLFSFPPSPNCGKQLIINIEVIMEDKLHSCQSSLNISGELNFEILSDSFIELVSCRQELTTKVHPTQECKWLVPGLPHLHRQFISSQTAAQVLLCMILVGVVKQ